MRYLAILICSIFVYSSNALAFLDTVSNIEITSLSPTAVDIKFDEVGSAEGYTILIGTTSVQDSSQTYNLPPINIGTENTYKIRNLQENGRYFFRVFATSSDDKSEFLSDEILIDLSQDNNLVANPNVTDVQVLNTQSLQIDFSKPMNFNEIENKIGIRKVLDGRVLEIRSISKIVDTGLLLETETGMDLNSDYEIFIQPSLKSLDDLSISNEEFVKRFTVENDTPDYFDVTFIVFEPTNAILFDAESFEIEFSRPVKFDENLKENINIFSVESPDLNLPIKEILLNEIDPRKILVICENVKDIDYIIEVKDIESNLGAELKENPAQIEVSLAKQVDFSVLQKPIVEQKTLKDIQNLKSSLNINNPNRVDLEFENPNDNPVDKFKVYIQSEDGSRFDLLEEFAKDLNKVALNIGTVKSKDVTLKVVAVDQEGNESIGVITKLLIPETGPASALVTLIGSSILGVFVHRRRK